MRKTFHTICNLSTKLFTTINTQVLKIIIRTASYFPIKHFTLRKRILKQPGNFTPNKPSPAATQAPPNNRQQIGRQDPGAPPKIRDPPRSNRSPILARKSSRIAGPPPIGARKRLSLVKHGGLPRKTSADGGRQGDDAAPMDSGSLVNCGDHGPGLTKGRSCRAHDMSRCISDARDAAWLLRSPLVCPTLSLGE